MGKSSSPVFSGLAVAGLAMMLIFAACMLGIASRPIGHLAALWPANAILLGIMLRYPVLARAAGWLGACAGYVLADLLTGTAWLPTLVLTAANLAGVVAGYFLLKRLGAEQRRLLTPLSVPCLVLAVAVASGVSGLVGAVADPLLFGGTPLSGWSFWFVTELVNYIAILPVLLTLPERPWRMLERRRMAWRAGVMKFLPMLSLLLSGIACLLVGGPGAVAFPVPALLWCALSYGVFGTALLTLLFSGGLLICIAYFGLPLQALDMNSRPMLLSLRMGITLAALAPLTVASVMAARDEALSRLQHMARHDQLSGLLNRWAFRESAEIQLRELRRQGRPVALLMLDIDHFKRINDSYGHAAGDTALRAFASRARECLRDGDLLARIGGEEFCLLLADGSASMAGSIAERIRSRHALAPITLGDGRQLSSTVSIGIAIDTHAEQTLDGLMHQADQALYRAKMQGRNRIELDEFPLPAALDSKSA